MSQTATEVTGLESLVKDTETAFEAVKKAKAAARTAAKEVEKFLLDQDVIITGYVTHEIAGGTVHERHKYFRDQPAKVIQVFFYFDEQWRLVDKFRVETPDGKRWQLRVTGTQVRYATPAQPSEDQVQGHANGVLD